MKKHINKIVSFVLIFLIVFGFLELALPKTTKAITVEDEEFLPNSILVSSNPLGNNAYITPNDLVDEYCDVYSGVSFAVKGWDAEKDSSGNVISGCETSYIKSGVLYQLDFTVTVSKDIYSEATVYPVFRYNDELNHGINKLVGIRYEESTPGAVEVSYQYTTNIPASNDPMQSVTDGGFAATLKAGKTYRYTYLFDLKSNNVNCISVYAKRLFSGTVKISNANLFSHKGTSADLFYFDGKVIPYLVKEEGNVITRMYGYLGVDFAGVGGSNAIVAKRDSSLYNALIEANKKYDITFDMRIPKGSVSTEYLTYSPSFDFAETSKLDYTEAYNNLHLLGVDNSISCYVQNTTQISYSAPSNGYSYYYTAKGTSTKNRRIYENISTAEFFNKSGVKLYTSNLRFGSAQGREANKNSSVNSVIKNNDWVNVKYSLNAQKGQSLRETTWAGYKLNTEYMQNTYFYYSSEYEYNNNYASINSNNKNIFVPSEDNVTVAFAIEYIFGGVAYDFDNFSFISESGKTEKNIWDFEDGSLQNITTKGNSIAEVVTSQNQPSKLGDKFLKYTTTGWDGLCFNFRYEQGYKYILSYDLKVLKYGTGSVSNGIMHEINKLDDGIFGADKTHGSTSLEKATNAALNLAENNIVTRYWENGKSFEKIVTFSNSGTGEYHFYERTQNDGVYGDFEGDIWNEWQHFEIEIDPKGNEYSGLVEYGIRPNDVGWVIGIDNFKITKIKMEYIKEAEELINGTYAFNIRAQSSVLRQGLRFKSEVDLSKFNTNPNVKILEYGTLVAVSEDSKDSLLTREAAKDKAINGKVFHGVAYNSKSGKNVVYSFDTDKNTIVYTGVLIGIDVAKYKVDYTVRSYVTIELIDGTITTVYDYPKTISVYDAAVQIVKTGSSEEDIKVARDVIDEYAVYSNSHT